MIKIIFILIIINLKTEDIISSIINDVQLTLEKQKDIEVLIKKLQTKYNTSSSNIAFYLFGIKIISKMQKTPGTVLLEKLTFSFQQDQIKKEEITTFQTIGFGISATTQDISLEAKKINAYIDLKNHENIDITFESDYKLKYQNFELGSNESLHFKDMSLCGSNLWGSNTTYNIQIKLKELNLDLKTKQAILCKAKIIYPNLEIESIIEKINANEQYVILNNILISIKNKKIKIEQGIININNKEEIQIKNIKCNEKQMQIFAPDGVIEIKKEQITLKNVIIYFKKSKITIEKVIIYPPSKTKSELLNIKIESKITKSISTIKKGSWNISTNTFKFSEGNI
ncbi:hypothetical protein [Alphaproteobacteria bacterium endosymbiont of Tiliacea citrago]|uniref:hypothetical protein n=1 Tax=Alphaproteobacteria bacterium endosymbiont of Tiliacea citrago TaxID=3077944 RepID=UPI00313D62E1